MSWITVIYLAAHRNLALTIVFHEIHAPTLALGTVLDWTKLLRGSIFLVVFANFVYSGHHLNLLIQKAILNL